MPKLPHIKMRPPPAGQMERLGRWFDQWNLEQRLRRGEPELAEAFRIAPPEQRHPRPELELFKVAEFDSNPRVGEIRLLDSGLFSESRRPLYVAILSEWPPVDNGREEKPQEPTVGISRRDISPRGFNPRFGSASKPEAEKSFLVAPFGRFSEPGTITEWLTGLEAGPLRVLCLWNTRDYPAKWLELGWKVGELTPQELADAREVFRHALTGVPLSDRLRQQVGAPIMHPRDPRLAYQEEEARLFTIVPEYAEQNEYDEFYPLWNREELALAAKSAETAPVEFAKYAVGETQLFITLLTQTNGEHVGISVLDQNDKPSVGLDGAQIVPLEGQPVRIENGRAVCLRVAVSKFILVGADGRRVDLRRVD